MRWGEGMPNKRPKTARKPKQPARARLFGRPAKAGLKAGLKTALKAGPQHRASRRAHAETIRKHGEVEAAIADARKSDERLREAIDILPQGVVFLDAEGRYILWNKKY